MWTALKNLLRSILVGAAVLWIPAAGAQGVEPRSSAPGGRFTFAWPLEEGSLKPRGAATRGAAVVLDPAAGAQWERLQAPAIDKFERDRRAILAMAGPYRVGFDFLEVVRYDPTLKPDAPYQSWGTEFVFVAEEREDFIALQHILVMRVQQQDGVVGEPMVVRHWRQEWRHEPENLLVYEGANTWALRELPPERRRGAWVQSVFQVDDSPRYAASGRWDHTGSFSTWISDETWRPLPRREFSVRKDYQVLVGTNRHTILPSGWVQEENNLKATLDVSGRPRERLPYIAREYGIARYDRIRDFDFDAGKEYYERTEPFWSEVREAWRDIIRRHGRFVLKAPVDQGALFIPFFEYAGQLADGGAFDVEQARAFIQDTLRSTYIAPASETAASRTGTY
jgi:hypothetical protein